MGHEPTPEPNATNNHSQTALHSAAAAGNRALVIELQGKGYKPEWRDSNGQTPVHLAAANGHSNVVKLFENTPSLLEIQDKRGRTVLHLAASNGHENIVSQLLPTAKIDAKDKRGQTPLHLATINGHNKVVDKLGVHASKDSPDFSGKVPLYYAAIKGHKKVAETLANGQGANLNAKDKGQTILHQVITAGDKEATQLLAALGAAKEATDFNGRTALYLAAQLHNQAIVEVLRKPPSPDTEGLLHRAAKEGNRRAAELLLGVNSGLKEARDSQDRTPLYVAAEEGHEPVVNLLFEQWKANKEASDRQKQTLLYRAAKEGKKEAVRLLLGINANPDAKDENGIPPLYIAVKNGHEEIAQMLVAKKADKQAKDDRGWTLLHRASSEEDEKTVDILLKLGANGTAKNKLGQTPLHVASKPDIVRKFDEYEVDPNIKDNNGQTPLHVAAGRGDAYTNIVEAFLDIEAEAMTTDNNGQTPLHAAASKGELETIILLARKDFINKNATDNNGRTPMHIAASLGHHAAVALLVDEGAEKEARDMNGRTPLHLAALHGHRQVIDHLIDRRASKVARDQHGNLPVHLAAANGDIQSVTSLINPTPGDLPPPKNVAEYRVYLRKFARDQLVGILDPNHPGLKDLAEEIVVRAQVVQKLFGLDADTVPGLVKLALYDIVVLCDDSGSMRKDSRIPALKETLASVAHFATFLEPSGISIRFLNNPMGFDNVVQGDVLEKVRVPLESKNLGKRTQLGTMLDSKIVQPMVIQKLEARSFNKPLIAFIITDGRPQEEDEEELHRTIHRFKTEMSRRGFKDGAIILIISQVGNSDEATKYLRRLEADEYIKSMVYCSHERLDELLDSLKRNKHNPTDYTALMIGMFVAALDKQTKASN